MSYDAWKTRSPDDERSREQMRADAEYELCAWHKKHMKAIDDECTRRQCELDAWYEQAVKDLDAEYLEQYAALENRADVL